MEIRKKQIVVIATLSVISFFLALGINILMSEEAEEPVIRAPTPMINPADESARLEAVGRFLQASQYLSTVKNGIQQSIDALAPQLPASAPALVNPLGAVDEKTFEYIAAPIFARHMTLQQALEIAKFYESDAGQALARQHQLGAPASLDPNAALQNDAATETFFKSEAGRILQAITADLELMRSVFQAVADNAK